MDLPVLLPLEDMTCVKIVQLLLSNPDYLYWKNEAARNRIKSKVAEQISTLVPFARIQGKLESFIPPLLYEVEKWTKFRMENWAGVYRNTALVVDHSLYELKDTIPHCWLSDGTIDREKSVRVVVKNEDINPVNRFIFACFFCMFEDVLYLWDKLFKIEKAFLRRENITMDENTDCVIRHWSEWLEGSTSKDWKSFVSFALGTDVFKRSVYILRQMLRSLSPTERSQCLFKALVGGEVNCDIMRFGLSALSKDEKEVVVRENPVEVLKCFLNWPLRNVFLDVADAMWPYVTESIYCRILKMMFKLIRMEDRECALLLINLKAFWRRSPIHLKEFAGKDPSIYKPVNLVLNHDLAQKFSKRQFFNACFED